MKEIENLIHDLEKSPVYAMSLGSHELFHSNFWAWMIENYDKNIAGIFFDKIDDSNFDVLKREEGNRDLTIYAKDNAVYIIENKLKSIPGKEQLDKYEEALNKTKKKFGGGVLTGISEADFKLGNWTFLSYKKIGAKLKEFVQCKVKKCFNDLLILEYADMVLLIDKIVNKFDSNYVDVLYHENEDNKDLRCKLDGIRLFDLCAKRNMKRFEMHLKDKLYAKLDVMKNYGFELKIESWFSHKSSVIQAVYIKDGKQDSKIKETETVFGVQIQAGKYQIGGHLRNADNVGKVFDYFASCNWLDSGYDSKLGKREIFGRETKMTKLFGKYEENGNAKNPYRYAYQYTVIKDFSFENLTKRILADMERAQKIIKQKYSLL